MNKIFLYKFKFNYNNNIFKRFFNTENLNEINEELNIKLLELKNNIKSNNILNTNKILNEILLNYKINDIKIGKLYSNYLPIKFKEYFENYIILNNNNNNNINNKTYLLNIFYLSIENPILSLYLYNKLLLNNIEINSKIYEYLCNSFNINYPPSNIVLNIYENILINHIEIPFYIIENYLKRICNNLSNNKMFYLGLKLNNLYKKYNCSIGIKNREYIFDQLIKRKFNYYAILEFELLKEEIRPETYQYIQIIKACIKEKEYLKAEKYCKESTFNGELLLPLTYIYSKEGKTNEIYEIINKMKENDITIDFYLNLIRSYGYNKDKIKIKNIYKNILSKYNLNIQIFQNLLIIFIEYLDINDFEKLINDILLINKNLFFHQGILYRILSYFCLNEKWILFSKYLNLFNNYNYYLNSNYIIKLLYIIKEKQRYDLVIYYSNYFNKFINGIDIHYLNFITQYSYKQINS